MEISSASGSSFTNRVIWQLLPFALPVTDVKGEAFLTCTNKISLKTMDSCIKLVGMGMRGSFFLD